MNAFGTFEATVQMVGELCERYPRPRILDIGCGEGAHLLALAPRIHGGFGIDVSRRAVSAATARSDGRSQLAFRVLEAERLPESDLGRFEIVLFIGSLEHMADPQIALAAARGRLRPDGRIVVVAISPSAPHAMISQHALRRSPMPVTRHLGVEGVRRVAAEALLHVGDVRPLYRGSRNSLAARTASGLLSLYDCVGGPTQAVVLTWVGERRAPVVPASLSIAKS